VQLGHITYYILHIEVDSALKDKERVGAMAKLSKSMEHEHQLALEAALKAKEAEGHAERVDQEKMLAMTNERLMDAVNQLCELGMEPSRWEKRTCHAYTMRVHTLLPHPLTAPTTCTVHHVHYSPPTCTVRHLHCSPRALFATCIVCHT
jgi:hypothetical protein